MAITAFCHMKGHRLVHRNRQETGGCDVLAALSILFQCCTLCQHTERHWQIWQAPLGLPNLHQQVLQQKGSSCQQAGQRTKELRAGGSRADCLHSQLGQHVHNSRVACRRRERAPEQSALLSDLVSMFTSLGGGPQAHRRQGPRALSCAWTAAKRASASTPGRPGPWCSRGQRCRPACGCTLARLAR